MDLVQLQIMSTQLVLKNIGVKRIYVDGGFSKNSVFMNLLAAAFPGKEVYAASTAQGSAVEAALCIHGQWNRKQVSNDIVGLDRFL